MSQGDTLGTTEVSFPVRRADSRGAVTGLGRLVPVDLRTYWSDEARDFTPWLAREDSLELLSETLGMDLELERIELAVGPYKADIVCRDISSGTKVIIENQLEKTNHDHLGKTFTYAAGLDARTIVWIAKEFTEEHRRALDFLNELATPNLRCFGIEMQLWKIGDSPPAPLFKLVSSPNDYTSLVRSTEADELTDSQSLYLAYWSSFKEFCRAKGTRLGLRAPRAQHWYNLAVGRSQFSLSLTASIQKQRIGCSIYMRGPNAKQAFYLMREQKAAIELETGTLEWMELPDKQDCRIARYDHKIDLTDRGQWVKAHSWLKEQAELFHKTFSPRIRQLPILDTPTEGFDNSIPESSDE